MKSYNYNTFLAVFCVGFFLLQLIATSNGRFFKALPIYLVANVVAIFIWYMQRKYAYIAVDLEKNTLNAASFFGLPSKKIPISTINHIGTKGMYAGGMTVMTITYILPDGKMKKVLCGGKESLDANFQKILDALVEINPKLHVPAELRK